MHMSTVEELYCPLHRVVQQPLYYLYVIVDVLFTGHSLEVRNNAGNRKHVAGTASGMFPLDITKLFSLRLIRRSSWAEAT